MPAHIRGKAQCMLAYAYSGNLRAYSVPGVDNWCLAVRAATLSRPGGTTKGAAPHKRKCGHYHAEYEFGNLEYAATVFDRVSARGTAALIVVVGAASLALRHCIGG